MLEIQGCGFYSKETTGVIKSPFWPKNYKGLSECMWNIAVPIGKKISLNFTHFDLEVGGYQICYDKVTILDINGLTNVVNKMHGRLVCF